MNRLTHKLSALLLAFALLLPNPAWPLREEQTETKSGLEEIKLALLEQDPVQSTALVLKNKIADALGLSTPITPPALSAAGVEELDAKVGGAILAFQAEPDEQKRLSALERRLRSFQPFQRTQFFGALPWLPDEQKVSNLLSVAFTEDSPLARKLRRRLLTIAQENWASPTANTETVLRILLARMSWENSAEIARKVTISAAMQPAGAKGIDVLLPAVVSIGAAESTIRNFREQAKLQSRDLYHRLALSHELIADSYEKMGAMTPPGPIRNEIERSRQVEQAYIFLYEAIAQTILAVGPNAQPILDWNARGNGRAAYEFIRTQLFSLITSSNPHERLMVLGGLEELERTYADLLIATRRIDLSPSQHNDAAQRVQKEQAALIDEQKKLLKLNSAGLEEGRAISTILRRRILGNITLVLKKASRMAFLAGPWGADDQNAATANFSDMVNALEETRQILSRSRTESSVDRARELIERAKESLSAVGAAVQNFMEEDSASHSGEPLNKKKVDFDMQLSRAILTIDEIGKYLDRVDAALSSVNSETKSSGRPYVYDETKPLRLLNPSTEAQGVFDRLRLHAVIRNGLAKQGYLQLTRRMAAEFGATSGFIVADSARVTDSGHFVIAENGLANEAATNLFPWIYAGEGLNDVVDHAKSAEAQKGDLMLVQPAEGISAESVAALLRERGFSENHAPRVAIGNKGQVSTLPPMAFQLLATQKGLPPVVFLNVAVKLTDEARNSYTLLLMT